MPQLSIKAMPLRKSGSAPIYIQVAEILEAQVVRSGREEIALPSEGELSREFGVSRVTVRQALKQLEARGLIYSEHGRGYFKSTPRIQGLSGFHSFTEEVRRLGGKPGSMLLDFSAGAELPDAFRRHLHYSGDAGAEFIFLRRLRSIDDVPVAVEEVYLPATHYPKAERTQFDQVSLYTELAAAWGVVPAWADALFEPIAAGSAEAELLRVPEGSPLLAVWRVTATDTDQVVEYVRSVYKGDGFMLNLSRYRL